MKLFSVTINMYGEFSHELVIAESKKEAEKKVLDMGWICNITCYATEIDILDGYKINLTKIE